MEQVTTAAALETSNNALQGVSQITDDSSRSGNTKLSLGYQLIQSDRDGKDRYSGVGHAGVGGSIGFFHRPSGICVGVMLNKADSGQEVTMRILRSIASHCRI